MLKGQERYRLRGLLVGFTLLGFSLLNLWTPGLARAGNIGLTGHDDDFHAFFGGTSSEASAQLKALTQFARDGSVLPVLTFDSRAELTSALGALLIPFVNIDPNNSLLVTDSLFNHSVYSAFIVASDISCGGCDNSPTGEANIAAHGTAIGNFLNAGGGIVGLSGAFSPNYYSFVPQTASAVGGAPTIGYSATGLFGIPAVNGDQTHNLFWNPGTHGESAFFQVAEVNSFGNGTVPGPRAAATLVCLHCTISGGVIGGGGTVPEPASLLLLGSGLVGLAAWRLKKLA